MSQYRKKYGLEWDMGLSDVMIDLTCWRYYHIPEYWEWITGDMVTGKDFPTMPSPEGLVLDVIDRIMPHHVIRNTWFEDITYAFSNHKEFVIMGPASANKSHGIGTLSLLDWCVAPEHTLTYFTSTTLNQLHKRSWKSLMEAFAIMKVLGGPGIYSKKHFAIVNENYKEGKDKEIGDDLKSGLFGKAVAGGNAELAVSDLIGVHFGDPRGGIRLFSDEAQATKQAFYDALTNLMIGTHDVRAGALGNPLGKKTVLGDRAEPPKGWATVTIEDHHWTSKYGAYVLHLDGLKSPAVVEPDGAKKYQFLINAKQIDLVVKQVLGNLKSHTYLSMVRGWFGRDMSVNVAISDQLLQQGKVFEDAEFDPRYRIFKCVGIDPAFTQGGDNCVVTPLTVGVDIRGMVTIQLGKVLHIPIEAESDKDSMYQVVEWLRRGMREGTLPRDYYGFDESGTQRLAQVVDHELAIQHIVKEIANNSPRSIENEIYYDQYDINLYGNRITELWYLMREFVMQGRVRGMNAHAAEDFATRPVEERDKSFVMMTKRKMRAEGMKSPDYGDSAVIALAVAIEYCGISSIYPTFYEPPAEEGTRFSVEVNDVMENEEIGAGFYVGSTEDEHIPIGMH